MKTWKRLLQTTCVAALVGATAMTVTASAAKAPVAKAPEKIPVILDADMVDLFDDGVALLILAQSPKRRRSQHDSPSGRHRQDRYTGFCRQ